MKTLPVYSGFIKRKMLKLFVSNVPINVFPINSLHHQEDHQYFSIVRSSSLIMRRKLFRNIQKSLCVLNMLAVCFGAIKAGIPAAPPCCLCGPVQFSHINSSAVLLLAGDCINKIAEQVVHVALGSLDMTSGRTASYWRERVQTLNLAAALLRCCAPVGFYSSLLQSKFKLSLFGW